MTLGLDTVNAVRDVILNAGALGPLVAILIYVAYGFIPLPAQILTLTIGAVYGPFWGVVIVWVGAMASALTSFAVGRYGGRPLAERYVPGPFISKMDGWVQRYGLGALLVLRLIPLVSFKLMNLAVGLTKVSWWTFAWTTGLGILPITIIEIVAADQLRQGNALGFWLLGGIAALMAAIWIGKRRYDA